MTDQDRDGAGAAPSAEGSADWLLSTDALEIGRAAIYEQLAGFRDSRISEVNCGAGCVIPEADGTPSSLTRFGLTTAVLIAVRAMLASSPRQAAFKERK